MTLSKDELIEIRGGKVSRYSLAFFIGGLITLITGMVDGYLRPLSCNK